MPEPLEPAADVIAEAGIADLQAAMQAGRFTARALGEMCLARIDALDRGGPEINAIIEVNPDALSIAGALDRERRDRGPRGPLHGIPVVLKDNIDTADRMQTTAGSLALIGAPPARDATVAAALRAAGAVILGKANLSEWANFRSTRSTSGWSGRGGLTRNPYALDRTPAGSSSGSAVAVAAGLAAASLGTETNGSIVAPASASGVVGIKPTVGLTSRAGVIPIAHSQDTVGPFGRTVADVAVILGALTGVDPRDPATAASAGRTHADYTPYLDPDGLRGARIGVVRAYFGASEKADAIVEAALDVMRQHGAVIVDPADIPTLGKIVDSPSVLDVLLYEFKGDLNAYLATRTDVPVRTLADVIAFNEQHRDRELPYFGQELFVRSEAMGPLEEPAYRAALEENHRLARQDGIDAVIASHRLDALVAPTGGPAAPVDLVNGDRREWVRGSSASTPAALAGYPLLSLPAGYCFGLPVNITFMGPAWSEPVLIRLAHAFEQAIKIRQPPRYFPSIPEWPAANA